MMTRFEGKDNFISMMEQILCDIKRGKSDIVSYDAMPCLDDENFCGPALAKYTFKIRDKKFDFFEDYNKHHTMVIQNRINDYLRNDSTDGDTAIVNIVYEADLMRIAYYSSLLPKRVKILDALNIDRRASHCITKMGDHHYINVALLRLFMEGSK